MLYLDELSVRRAIAGHDLTTLDHEVMWVAEVTPTELFWKPTENPPRVFILCLEQDKQRVLSVQWTGMAAWLLGELTPKLLWDPSSHDSQLLDKIVMALHANRQTMYALLLEAAVNS